jgi:GLPGLI family protein
MKTSITTTFALLFIMTFSAQDFQGKAIYKTHRKLDFKFDDDKGGVELEMHKKMEAQWSKMFQKTFILVFDKTQSTYKEDIKLAAPAPQSGIGSVMIFGGGGKNDILYKNIKEHRFSNSTNIMGKPFLIKDTLLKMNWELSGETKNIGIYTCYKATSRREIEDIKISHENGELKEEKVTETIITTAWYTTQIPVSTGPREFVGLPGLILEINDGKTTIICSEIELNSSEKIIIEEPQKGKEISQKDFDILNNEKMKELMENFHSKRGNGIGHEFPRGG